ncbi:MAG: endo-1,4-beta-xylanase [Acidobacteriota bacterium]|nr:endo-1,4-beta-xylanase [Acidobacteriota bacterium]
MVTSPLSAAIESKSKPLARKPFVVSARLGNLLLIALILNFCSACRLAATAENDSSGAENASQKARNEAALSQARNNIEKFRKGDARIKILDARGKAVGGAQINIKQISHDFKFGCYLKIDDLAAEKLPAYEAHFSKLFNYAVVGAYWDFVENRRGAENWAWFEKEVALARKLKLRVAAAPVLWGTNDAGTPAWLPHAKDELLPLLKRRVQATVAKYENAVDDWEIVNEPLAPKADVFAERIGSDYVEQAFGWAREAAPGERLMINEYGVFGSGGKQNYNREKYFSLLKELIENGASIDVVGIQAHSLGEWFEPANVSERLNAYAALGKPVQITEFSAQIFDYEDKRAPLGISGAYRGGAGVWNEEKQAEFYREFYTIAFGSPQVEAIVTWGLDDERAWLPGIGLIDAGGNPKANYKTLDRLINNEWRTNLQINAGGAGKAAEFRGFYGAYEVEVIAGAKRAKAVFELKKGDENEWIVRL